MYHSNNTSGFRPSRVRAGPTTFIRDLPYSVLVNVAKQLDPDGTSTTWRDLALNIPISSMNPNPRFTNNDIQHFELSTQRGKSATEAVLQAWATSNVTAQDLVNVFHKMHLPKLADIVLPPEPLQRRFDPPSYRETMGLDAEPSKAPTHQSTGFQQTASHVSSTQSMGKREPIEHDSMSLRQPTENCTTDISEHLSLEELSLDKNLPSFSYSDLSELTSNFNESCKLGEGAFGSVFSGNLHLPKHKPIKSDARKIAIKRLKLDAPDLAVAVAEQFKKEIHIISELEHENILPLVGYSCDGPELCLVYDFMFNGSLSSNLQGCREGTNQLSVAQRLQIAEGSAAGIEYLHNKKLVHRDIKSSNILLDTETRPRISDFGLIRSVISAPETTSTVTKNPIGTPLYMAPEAIRGEVSTAMDVYSFGIVILELLTSRAVYDRDRSPPSLLDYVMDKCDEQQDAIMDLIDNEAGHWRYSVVMEIYELSSDCLNYRRKTRPAMSKVLTNIRTMREKMH
uniref:interleukin-1 receptor-associated kinase 4-like n=1 Tax=Styela clava TaxID=7725 RepID=UPI00193975F5|nr:interleukin-1 receptor-associated kinase 4-like [Styela clava]